MGGTTQPGGEVLRGLAKLQRSLREVVSVFQRMEQTQGAHAQSPREQGAEPQPCEEWVLPGRAPPSLA